MAHPRWVPARIAIFVLCCIAGWGPRGLEPEAAGGSVPVDWRVSLRSLSFRVAGPPAKPPQWQKPVLPQPGPELSSPALLRKLFGLRLDERLPAFCPIEIKTGKDEPSVPQWSPTGQRLAFQAGSVTKILDYRRFLEDGTAAARPIVFRPHEVTLPDEEALEDGKRTQSRGNYSLAWAPDGRRFAILTLPDRRLFLGDAAEPGEEIVVKGLRSGSKGFEYPTWVASPKEKKWYLVLLQEAKVVIIPYDPARSAWRDPVAFAPRGGPARPLYVRAFPRVVGGKIHIVFCGTQETREAVYSVSYDLARGAPGPVQPVSASKPALTLLPEWQPSKEDELAGRHVLFYRREGELLAIVRATFGPAPPERQMTTYGEGVILGGGSGTMGVKPQRFRGPTWSPGGDALSFMAAGRRTTRYSWYVVSAASGKRVEVGALDLKGGQEPGVRELDIDLFQGGEITFNPIGGVAAFTCVERESGRRRLFLIFGSFRGTSGRP